MAVNLDTKRGPSGNRILHLPQSAATTPAAPAPAPAPPTAPDVLEILRNAPKRGATKAQLAELASKWNRQ